jgi:5-amino-6-(5-phosphoribosylamino)uracil reductase
MHIDGTQTLVVDPAEFTLATAMQRLRTDYGVSSLLCEGGPTLFGSLIHEQLVDELFLTLAPKLAGGGNAPTIASGAELTEPAQLELRWVLEHAGSLFLRFAVSTEAQ